MNTIIRSFIITALMLMYADASHAAATNILIWKESKDSITIDRYSLQKIFTRKITKWPNGQHVRVFVKPVNSIEHREFTKRTLGLTPYQYKQMLESETYTGRTTSVVEVTTDQQMLMKIDQTPGSIGYINYEVYAGTKKIIVIDTDTITD